MYRCPAAAQLILRIPHFPAAVTFELPELDTVHKYRNHADENRPNQVNARMQRS